VKIDKRFISNLATYLMGIAIGIMFVGLILSMKQRVFANHQAEQEAEAAASQNLSENRPATGE